MITLKQLCCGERPKSLSENRDKREKRFKNCSNCCYCCCCYFVVNLGEGKSSEVNVHGSLILKRLKVNGVIGCGWVCMREREREREEVSEEARMKRMRERLDEKFDLGRKRRKRD